MKKIAIIGFGSQAKAWALNLRDSNIDLAIGLRAQSHSIQVASKMGFQVFDFESQANNYSHFIILTPDESHLDIVARIHEQKKGATFIYAHGFAVSYSSVKESTQGASHILLAPKAIASELRFEYETKGKLAAVYSLEFNLEQENKKILRKLSEGIGITCLRECSFYQETISDLFSEQSLLCSILPYASLASFNTLRKNGIPKEIAFFECWHEVKLIANTLIKIGPLDFFKLVSPNALIGSQIGQNTLIDEEYHLKLEEIFSNIENKNFLNETNHFEDYKKKTLEFWKSQELTEVYNELKAELY